MDVIAWLQYLQDSNHKMTEILPNGVLVGSSLCTVVQMILIQFAGMMVHKCECKCTLPKMFLFSIYGIVSFLLLAVPGHSWLIYGEAERDQNKHISTQLNQFQLFLP